MKANRIAKWFNEGNRYIDPPGCESTLVSLPTGDEGCCTIGIVHEHRFAFYFWGINSTNTESPHSILISIDAHDDTGVPNEVIPKDLDNLNVHSRKELGLFSWLRLRSLNDGHILPALYLAFFSDAYILLNDKSYSNDFETNCSEMKQKDCNDKIHTVKFYQDLENLLHDLPENCPVFLDIDLDYFAIENIEAGSVLGSEKLIYDSEIRSFLSIDSLLLGSIFNRIVGMNHSIRTKILRRFSQFSSCLGYFES
jgi:hypothetical protein